MSIVIGTTIGKYDPRPILIRGLPFSTYAPRGGGWGQASYTFPLRTTWKKGEGWSRKHEKMRTY